MEMRDKGIMQEIHMVWKKKKNHIFEKLHMIAMRDYFFLFEANSQLTVVNEEPHTMWIR